MINEIKINLIISAHQGEVWADSESSDSDDWIIEDWVTFYRACLLDQSENKVQSRELEGPYNYSKDSFEKVVDAALLEIRIQIMRRFEELNKPTDLIDAFKART